MARDHGFHQARVLRVIDETPDARTYVLDAPFAYEAGQFVTFRACGTLRSYSMSRSPDTDPELATTVKRVPPGRVYTRTLGHPASPACAGATAPAGGVALGWHPGPSRHQSRG